MTVKVKGGLTGAERERHMCVVIKTGEMRMECEDAMKRSNEARTGLFNAKQGGRKQSKSRLQTFRYQKVLRWKSVSDERVVDGRHE